VILISIERLLCEEIDAFYSSNKRIPNTIVLSEKALDLLVKESYTPERKARDLEEISLARSILKRNPITVPTYDGIPIDKIEYDGILIHVK
jgi:hypothetical protein